MTELPDHDNDRNVDIREDLWAHLATRFDGSTYLNMRNHFDDHIEKDGVEKAYNCLTKMLLMYIERQNHHLASVYEAATADSMGEGVIRDEE